MKLSQSVYSILFATTIFSVSVSANDRDEICNYYGNVGAAAVDFLLPLSFQQVVNMVSGKDADLLDKMSKAVEGKGSKATRKKISAMGDDALELLGEAAGFHGFQLTLTGQATSGEEVFLRLSSQCQQMGPEAIIETQRRARAVQ